MMNDAVKAITRARQEIEKLINKTPMSDEYTLGQIGPILSELRQAERTIKNLTGEKE